jgi:catechol 2,3-dioxygenase-like lactoylglutathione lyase family enzyme
MQLNHLDVPVPQTFATKTFFVEHLGFKCVFEREDGLTVLIDEVGFALTLSPLPNDESLKNPTGFHVGFNLQEEIQVVQTHDKLVSMGTEIVRPLSQLGGALTFQRNAPGPVLVEFSWRPRR